MSERTEERYFYIYIHNVFADFIQASLEYFSEVYPRYIHKVVSTYDKGVEYINKQIEYGRNPDKPNVPALILNPTGDFNVDDSNTGARQVWRFANLAPGLISRLYDPIYNDKNVKITVGFTRLKGEIELISLLPSFYEYFDLKLLMIQMFTGPERHIYPIWVNTFIILPQEVYGYTYRNEYTGQVYTLDWSEANISNQLVKTTNRNEMVIPCRIKPLYKMTGLTDASARYSNDRLADWRLSCTIEYQIEIPSFMLLISNFLAENIKVEIRHSSVYTAAGEDFNQDVPANRDVFKTHWNVSYDTTSVDGVPIVVLPEQADIVEDKELVFKIKYFHIVTQEQVDSSNDITITIPEVITDNDTLLLLSSKGYLNYGDHFIVSSGNQLTIKKANVTLYTGQVLELLIYELSSGIGSSITIPLEEI